MESRCCRYGPRLGVYTTRAGVNIVQGAMLENGTRSQRVWVDGADGEMQSRMGQGEGVFTAYQDFTMYYCAALTLFPEDLSRQGQPLASASVMGRWTSCGRGEFALNVSGKEIPHACHASLSTSPPPPPPLRRPPAMCDAYFRPPARNLSKVWHMHARMNLGSEGWSRISLVPKH